MFTVSAIERIGRAGLFGVAGMAVMVLFLSAPAFAGDGGKLSVLRLIPTPKKVTSVEGTFKFTSKTHVVLARPGDSKDTFAAQQLLAEVEKDLKLKLKLQSGKACAASAILIGRIGRDKAIDKALAKLEIKPPEEIGEEGYVLVVGPGKIVIGARGSVGVFYGVQTLKQLIRGNATGSEIPCCRIIDWPVLRYRGWQDDISRGPIPTLEYMKREIRTLSEYKLNLLTLYTEHVFKLKKHPKIAPPDGITADQVKELCAYAKKHHVQVVGNFQSFGHFSNILRVPGYEHLGKAGAISPEKEESYKFLADVYGEIAPAYDSPLFIINCDEVSVRAYDKMAKKMGVAGVYVYHINRINKLLKPYGKTPMMWSDVALRHKDILPKLPKNLIILSWGYLAHNNFDGAILPFRKRGFDVFVCPGTSSWIRIWPNFTKAVINISNYVRDGAHHGAIGMLNTTWRDDGENLFSYNWYPLLWGAECAWEPAIAKDGQDPKALRNDRHQTFSKAFDAVFHGRRGDTIAQALLALSNLREFKAASAGWGLETRAFWRYQWRAVSADRAVDARKFLNDANSVIATLKAAKSGTAHNADSLDFAIFAARRARFVAERELVAAALGSPDSEKQVSAGLEKLRNEVLALKAEYERLWNLENRPWWLRRNLRKYDNLARKLLCKKEAL